MLVSVEGCSLPSTLSLCPSACRASLSPPRTCLDPSVQVPGCSCSSVWQDAPCPAPSPSALRLVDASLPPARICPDPSVQVPGRSCSSVRQDAPCPAPSLSAV